MRLLQVVHGYPPELFGGTERTVQELSRALVDAGHQVAVLAGSLEWRHGTCLRRDEDSRGPGLPGIPVWRLHRGDPFFDHWHKSRSPQARQLFEEVLNEFRPDVVHIHHWLRLSRDLVAAAARLSIPAVVSLHDLSTSCLISFRVRPGTLELCRAPLAPNPCLACAASRPPFTPWVDGIEGRMRLQEHARDLIRELSLARVRVVPSASHGHLLAACLGRDFEESAADVLPPGRGRRLQAWPGPATAGSPLELALFGHLSPIKGVHLALEALHRLPDPSAVRLHLLGGDAEADYARQLRSQAQGLDVRFHGAYSAASLEQHPARFASALLATSLGHESYGLVLDEALDLGLPWLVPAAGAFEERAKGQPFARLYPPGDAAALSALLSDLLADPSRIAALRAAVPPAGSPGFDWAAHAAAMEPLYLRAQSAGAPSIEPRQWYEDRLEQHQNELWEQGLSKTTWAELGFPEPGVDPP